MTERRRFDTSQSNVKPEHEVDCDDVAPLNRREKTVPALLEYLFC
jgi:hypothetical protein